MNEKDEQFLQKFSEAIDSGPLAEDAPLDAGSWDSIVVLSVISLIDETYDVTIPVDELQAIDSVPALFARIRAAAA